jgi:uridylate kinase
MATPEKYVISLGGSLFFTADGIDIDFLKLFKEVVLLRVAAGDRFVIVVGGGKTSRQYQRALEQVDADNADRDWVGIYATRLNANFVRLMFGHKDSPEIFIDPEGSIPDAPIVFGGGSQPGWSTDYVSTVAAKTVGAKKVINLTSASHVYDKDPSKFSDAKSFDDLTWAAYKTLIPTDWNPGMHTPFDPRAAREAEANGTEVLVIGKDIKNFEAVLGGKPFVGTRIHV